MNPYTCRKTLAPPPFAPPDYAGSRTQMLYSLVEFYNPANHGYKTRAF